MDELIVVGVTLAALAARFWVKTVMVVRPSDRDSLPVDADAHFLLAFYRLRLRK